MEKETVGLRVAQQLLDDARSELTRADEKASSALGTTSALIAVAAVAPGEPQLGRHTLAWGWVCGLLICAVATILLMLAALPRFTTSRRHVIAYFGDVTRVRHEQDLGCLLGRLSERPSDALLAELRAISRIVLIKYRFTRLGILFAVAGAALLVISAI